MDFTPTEDQEELRASVRRVLSEACPPALVRQVFEGKDGEYDPGRSPLWARMAQLDWPALTIPEQYGGMGFGAVELNLVVGEMGRALAPSPFMATVTQFAPMVRETAPVELADRLLRPIAEGRSTGTLALAEPSGRWELPAVTTTARRSGTGWVID